MNKSVTFYTYIQQRKCYEDNSISPSTLFVLWWRLNDEPERRRVSVAHRQELLQNQVVTRSRSVCRDCPAVTRDLLLLRPSAGEQSVARKKQRV